MFLQVEDLHAELEREVRSRSRGRLDLLASAISPDKSWAVTLLQVRTTGYWLESLYRRSEDRWVEHTTSNGVIAYSGTGENEAGEFTGVLRFYGEAPVGSNVALIRWCGSTYEVPVTDGHFVFAVWEARESDSDVEPEVVEFR